MRFAHFSHVWGKTGFTAAARYDQLWRELALCDQLGFEFSFCVEHHFSRVESWMASPAIYCASVAARTRRIRPGPMGYVTGLYNPIRIAEEVAMLDNLSGGRLEVGLVSGIVPHFFSGYGADFSRRKEALAETVALLRTAAAAAGEPFDFDGPLHRYKGLTLSVQPLQKPYPPLWIATRDPESLPFLARNAIDTNYVFLFPREEVAPRYREYLKLWRAAGHPRPPRIGYWALVHVDETDQRALERARRHVMEASRRFLHAEPFEGPLERYHETFAEFFERRGEPGLAGVIRHLLDFDYLLERKLIFVGAPDTVAKNLREAASDGLFNTLFAEFNLGEMGEEDLMRSIRLFAEQVMPELREFEPF